MDFQKDDVWGTSPKSRPIPRQISSLALKHGNATAVPRKSCHIKVAKNNIFSPNLILGNAWADGSGIKKIKDKKINQPEQYRKFLFKRLMFDAAVNCQHHGLTMLCKKQQTQIICNHCISPFHFWHALLFPSFLTTSGFSSILKGLVRPTH